MSKIVIVGGKLQGSEAAYLGREAGIQIVLIDKDPMAPAQNLCNKFICGDVLSDDTDVVNELETANMILPTMENEEVLQGLVKLCSEKGYNLAFDWEAYKISSSKIMSDRLFAENDLPCPRYYPAGNAPYIAKPSGESGSHGVCLLDDEDAVKEFLINENKKYIVQEYVEGPSYSVEIIGMPGNYRTYEITEIFVDEVYDCNLAATLHTINPELKKQINLLAMKIAELINLKGIMDLEVIDHNGEIKILEIDARLPSQTPIVVYHASGMNYIEELYDLFCHGRFTKAAVNMGSCASLIHYRFVNGQITTHGEHIMVEGGKLRYTEGICSDAVVISDYSPGKKSWRGTFINWGKDLEELENNEAKMRLELTSRFGVIRGDVNDYIYDSSKTEIS